jgi:homospermidine synthase
MRAVAKECIFGGRLVLVGFGCIGQGVLPLLLHHVDMHPRQMLVIAPGDDGDAVAQSYGVQRLKVHLTADNLAAVLKPLLGEGDFLLNLSVDVSTTALIEQCQRAGALYLDTCIEPWAGGYFDGGVPPGRRTNHALREAALALRSPAGDGPTAVLTHGANPGLVSHFVKQALHDLAARAGLVASAGPTPEWARLACDLGLKVIHIAERDTQVAARRKAQGEFVNTWSPYAFVSEGCQPAELGWGTHERHFPADALRHEHGSPAAIYLQRPGASTRVRSWCPLLGAQHAFLITHGESISIAHHLTLGDPQRPDYRPTVHYAYHPCDDAVLSLHELAGRNWRMQPHARLLKDDITSGVDELGVLLMGDFGAYWYGSRLSIEQARELAPHNSATSLQVTAAVMAGVVWAMRNPRRDIVEPDDLPHEEILAMCRPYLGELFGTYTPWTPLEGRALLFPEDVDPSDPWQFKNFRVT